MWINPWRSPEQAPKVSYAFGVPSAAFGNSSGGLLVNVSKATETGDIELFGPTIEIFAYRIYTYCFWVRIAANSPIKTSFINVYLENQTESWDWIGKSLWQSPVTTTWQQRCLSGVERDPTLPGKTWASFTVQLGVSNVIFNFDNPVITSVSAPPPPRPPSPQPPPRPPSPPSPPSPPFPPPPPDPEAKYSCTGNVAGVTGCVEPSTYPAPVPSSNGPACYGTVPASCSAATATCPHCAAGLKRWDANATWTNAGNRVPVSNATSDVTLPPSSRVLLSGCMLAGGARFRTITVPAGSELIIDDAPLNLAVSTIVVRGTLSMGSPTCRLKSSITITFVPSVGVNTSNLMLQVTSTGKLDVHGALYSPTWTRLSATAYPGQRWVQVQAAVNWRAGQLVAVPTSLWKDECRNQNEVRVVQSVSPDGRNITFTSPLSFLHYGGPEYQTEVVLLSRNILLQGSPDTAGQRAGGHVRVESKFGRIRGVMAYRMGQQFNIGSYPFHFHLAGDVGNNSYLTDNSVYNSWWRCYTIHGTHGLLVQGNTGFHIQGHCFYLEDGVEERNRLDGNFAGFVHPLGRDDTCTEIGSVFGADPVYQTATLVQPADWAASGFYISNPYNWLTNNAASGGASGFVFVHLDAPIGLSRNATLPGGAPLVPHQRPVGLFEGNTAHSSGYHWGEAAAVYAGGDLGYDEDNNKTLVYTITRHTFDPRDVSNPDKEATNVLRRTKVWLGGASVSTYGDRFMVDGLESHDGTLGATVRGDPNYLINADINLNSNHSGWLMNVIGDDLQKGYRYGFMIYDVYFRHVFLNVTIRNVPYIAEPEWEQQAAVGTITWSDQFKPGHLASMRGIRFVNVTPDARLLNPVRRTGAWRFYNFLDTDGSFTGRARPTLLGAYSAVTNTGPAPDCVPGPGVTCPQFNWWRADDSCTTAAPLGTAWNAIACDWYPWRTVANLYTRVPGYTSEGSLGDDTNEFDAGAVYQFGYKGAAARSTIMTRTEGVTGLTGKGGWYVHWTLGAPKNFEVHVDQLPRGTSIIYATRYPAGTTFSIVRVQNWLLQPSVLRAGANLAAVLADPTGDVYFFDGKLLYMKIYDLHETPYQGREDVEYRGVQVPGSRWELYYNVTAKFTTCTSTPAPTQNGKSFAAQFCAMAGTADDYIPANLTTPYDQWPLPYCTDIAPPLSVCAANNVSAAACTCPALVAAGRCAALSATWPAASGAEMAALAAKAGGFCGVACGRCTENKDTCLDAPMPPVVSGGRTCAQLVPLAKCYEVAPLGFCHNACGVCSGRGLPCLDYLADGADYTCADLRSWGSCNETWVVENSYCRATCGACAGPPPPPRPPSPPPPPPQPSTIAATFDTAANISSGWSMWINPWRSPEEAPQASYAFGSAAAAYTGSTGGLFVNVSKTSPDAWDIELQGPTIEVFTGRLFTCCMWVRLASNSPAKTSSITIYLQNQTDTWDWVGDSLWQAPINTTWQQRCLSNVGKDPSATAPPTFAKFKVMLGASRAVIHIDNPIITTTNAPSPPPVAAASKSLNGSSTSRWGELLPPTPDAPPFAPTTTSIPAPPPAGTAISRSQDTATGDSSTGTTQERPVGSTSGPDTPSPAGGDPGTGGGGAPSGGSDFPVAAVVGTLVAAGVLVVLAGVGVAVVMVKRRQAGSGRVVPLGDEGGGAGGGATRGAWGEQPERPPQQQQP